MSTTRRVFLKAAGATLAVAVVSPAYALTVKEAKAAKKVVEAGNGYLRALDPAMKDQVADWNKMRKARYEEIAKQTGTTLQAVEGRSAAKIKAAESQ